MPATSKRPRGRPTKAAIEATNTLLLWTDTYCQSLQAAPITGNWRAVETALDRLKQSHTTWQLAIEKKDAS